MILAPHDAAAARAEAPWWPVGTTKFVVMTLGTLGIYHYYWIYGNWKRMRAREGAALSPVWRTFFAPVTVYRMFAAAAESASTAGVRPRWSAVGLAAAYFIANVALLAAVPAWMAGPLLLLPVLPVQMTMARVNVITAPAAPRNERFTLTDYAILAAGAALTAGLWAEARAVDDLLQEWNP
ncbi:MAG TPA: hypothetical protein VMT93_10515 [Gemmatimonadaceae bacterium]|nr:hypothetical protein [Gemmatimonadaceae bacterium]